MKLYYGFTVNGIQAYIFETNNLREIIGASEIVEAVCTDWFEQFLKDNPTCDGGVKLQNAAGNIKYLTTESGAKRLFEGFSEYVNNKAPGLPFSQAISKDLESLEASLSAQRNLPQYDYDTGHMGRFHARTTGNLAVEMKAKHVEQGPLKNYQKKRSSIDRSNFQKFIISEQAKSRLCEKAGVDESWLTHDFEEMAENGKHSWLALIHIDGNGMGNYIKSIAKKNSDSTSRSKAINEFAEKFSKCTNSAFKLAFQSVFRAYFEDENGNFNADNRIPFRPLILGGDDVTVILRADFAIPFVFKFLEAFKAETKNHLPQEFTACAGVAFVKAKFPFHYTTDLAEELCSTAKEASKREKLAVLFHKVSDSFITDYEELVERELTLPNGKKIAKAYYDIYELEKLNVSISELQNEKGIKNALRQYVDLLMNDSPEASLIVKRANKKYQKWTDLKKEQYADYLTLLAVQ